MIESSIYNQYYCKLTEKQTWLNRFNFIFPEDDEQDSKYIENKVYYYTNELDGNEEEKVKSIEDIDIDNKNNNENNENKVLQTQSDDDDEFRIVDVTPSYVLIKFFQLMAILVKYNKYNFRTTYNQFNILCEELSMKYYLLLDLMHIFLFCLVITLSYSDLFSIFRYLFIFLIIRILFLFFFNPYNSNFTRYYMLSNFLYIFALTVALFQQTFYNANYVSYDQNLRLANTTQLAYAIIAYPLINAIFILLHLIIKIV